MQWWKRLSQSDARQKTEGGFMPFRFTKDNCPGDFTKWFRNEFFGDADWHDTTQRELPVEEAEIRMSVDIRGEDFGQRDMKLTHAERRHENNHAPATYLNFDTATNEYLNKNDMTGKYIVFSKGLNGDFKIVIQDEKPE